MDILKKSDRRSLLRPDWSRGILSCAAFLIAPVVVAAIVFLGFPVSGFAQTYEKGSTPFRLGALDLFPGFRGGISFDDNIFLTQRNEESDTIYHYTPSLAVNLPFAAASSANAKIVFDILDFSDNDREDTENLTIEGNLNLERIFGRFYSRTNAAWSDTSEISSSEEESAIGPRRERTLVRVDTAAGYGGYDDDRIRLQVSGGYSEERFDRAADDRLNEDILRAGALGDYRISPKTWVRLEYGFENNDFVDRLASDSSGGESNSHFVRAGVAFSPGALVTGSATFGVQIREFDKTTTTAERDETGFSASVDLTWEARPSRTEIRGKFTSSLETAASADEFGFREYTGEIGVSQGLFFISDRLKADVAFSLERNDFLRSDREDDIVKLLATLTYRRQFANMPWFASVVYEFARRDSNVDVNDYENNIITFNLGVQY